ncbi:hypothetical protein M5K25_025602 [Dendrobium thyrsiflorum]|uniref:Uncharacterized protein n=1 Tax=Dendrobium thyrsiflorum TaxID=117978 RepID=A0ABD0U9U5_DENTH
MGKKNSEASVHHSSIALLQERFRQLERVKELREEREQNKALTDAGRRSPSTCYEQQQQQPATSKWFIHPDLIHPSGPLSGGGPSSSLRSHEEHNEIQNFDTPLSIEPLGYSEGDVDTSLHL